MGHSVVNRVFDSGKKSVIGHLDAVFNIRRLTLVIEIFDPQVLYLIFGKN
jgi:hypothetical protein